MIFKGEKTFVFRSIFWIVFFINLSLSSFFEAKGQDEIIWEMYKIDKSKNYDWKNTAIEIEKAYQIVKKN